MPLKKSQINPFLRRAIALAALWLVLSGADFSSWLVGAPTVLLAAWVSRKLETGDVFALSLRGLVRFAPFFLLESFRGGVDVARRILGPKVRIQPGFRQYRSQLPNEPERLFLAGCISLLPGTLSVRLNGNVIDIHTLDQTLLVEEHIRKLEHKVARVFSVSLD